MAQYKVPQDVEADDKLIGPFSFRQFVYLLIAAGCIAVGVALFKLFPLLAIIPMLPALLLIVLALPLKKDQPMETYLAAIVSYYLKPRKRTWAPGQRETTIEITAPKVVEDTRARDITGEEATHRLSFLADIVDTEGYAIKGATSNNMREELLAEANEMPDMFEVVRSDNLSNAIERDENERHERVISEMQQAIQESEDVFVKPDSEVVEKNIEKPKTAQKVSETVPKPSIIELANNPDFSVATIAKEADRINRKEEGEGEVFISLH